MAEGVTVANAFVQVMPSAEGMTSNLTDALLPSVGGAGTAAGTKFGTLFAAAAGPLLIAAGGALAGVFAAGAIKDAFETVEAGFNNVKLATGATGEQAEALKAVYLDVSKSVSGSFEDIGSAVGELNTRFGLQGEALEAASEQAMKYAKVTGQDATSAIQDVSRMMNNAGISADEYADVLDKLTVAGQVSGVNVGKLATSVTDNATSFKELGFSTDEAIAMLAKFEVSGANTSAILSGMKKGVAAWTKEGKSAKDGFADFVRGVQDGTVSAADAIELFGSKSGMEMYEAAQKGQLSFDDMYAAIANDSEGALDSVYQSTLTAQEKFDILGKKLQAGFFEILEPIVTALTPYVDAALEGIGAIIEGVVGVVVPAMDAIAQAIAPVMDAVLPELQAVFNDVMGGVGGIVAEVWPVIQDVITTVSGTVGEVIATAWPAIRQVVETVMGALQPFVETAWGGIKDFITSAMEGVRAFMKDVWPAIQQVIQTVMGVLGPFISTAWNGIQTVMGTVMGAIQSVIQTVWPTIQGIVTTVMGAIDTAIRAIQPIVQFVSGIFDGVRRAIEDPMRTAQGIVGGIIDTIKGFFNFNIQWPHIPLPHFSVSGSINPLDWLQYGPPSFSIEWWGKGGFADEPTLSGYAEKGPELYWPSYEPYFDKYAKGIAEHMPQNGVDIHDCTFVIREESDIRKVAEQLNSLINRQTAGGIA